MPLLLLMVLHYQAEWYAGYEKCASCADESELKRCTVKNCKNVAGVRPLSLLPLPR